MEHKEGDEVRGGGGGIGEHEEVVPTFQQYQQCSLTQRKNKITWFKEKQKNLQEN